MCAQTADVVGGWLVGLLALGFVLKVVPWLEPRLQKWTATRQVVATLLLGGALLAIFPSDWDGHRPAETGTQRRPADRVSLGLDLGSGTSALRRRRTMEAAGAPLCGRDAPAACLLSGSQGVVQANTEGNFLLGPALRLVRYAVVGFAITGLAPWMLALAGFGKLHLA